MHYAHQNNIRKHIRTGLITLFIGVIVIFSLTRLGPALFGGKLTLTITKIHDGLFSVTGNAPHARSLTINGKETAVTEKGVYNEVIAPLPGFNLVTVATTDRFGHSDTKAIPMYYQPNQSVAQVSTQTHE